MKFSIRDLFLVTVIVALAVACLVVHNGNIYAEKNATALEEVLKDDGWTVDHFGSGIVIHKFDTSRGYSISKGKLTRLP
jgi:hypothetical protein